MTEEEVNRLALDIYRGSIFTDRHLPPSVRKDILHLVFMPLIFTTPETITTWEAENGPLGMIYERMEQAGPTGINGYPIFMSSNLVNKVDTDKVWVKFEKIRAAAEGVMNEGVLPFKKDPAQVTTPS